MPYQDHHLSDANLPIVDSDSGEPAQNAPNARSIQIIVVVGLVLAIVVAVFGRY